MPASTQELLNEFFTPERLAYYRDLHGRYPLWCGDWSEKHLQEHDAHSWLALTRLQQEADQLYPKAEVLRVQFASESGADSIALPRLLVAHRGSDQLDRIDDIKPPAAAALLAAANYALARWRSGYGPGGSGEPYADPPFGLDQQLMAWANHISALLTRKDPRFVGVVEGPGPTGHVLWVLRDRFLSTPPDHAAREKRGEELEHHWIRMGREVGVVPRVKGGRVCTLPDDLIEALRLEGRTLVREVTEREPDAQEIDAVRCLVGKDVLDDLQTAHLRELPPERAATKRDGYLRKFDRKHDVALWAFRLRFPMLSAPEVRDVTSMWQQGPKREDRHQTIATRLLADRLCITPKQILSRTRKFRP
jgi:hypothetical protein